MPSGLIELITDMFSPEKKVTENTAFKMDLELDSFEIINLICALEEKYDMTINEMDMASLVTVGDLSDYLKI
jgi:acyl carrier protein